MYFSSILNRGVIRVRPRFPTLFVSTLSPLVVAVRCTTFIAIVLLLDLKLDCVYPMGVVTMLQQGLVRYGNRIMQERDCGTDKREEGYSAVDQREVL